MEMMLQNKVAVIYGAGGVETVANCTDEKKAHCESNWGMVLAGLKKRVEQ
jgi:hypothetical protein